MRSKWSCPPGKSGACPYAAAVACRWEPADGLSHCPYDTCITPSAKAGVFQFLCTDGVRSVPRSTVQPQHAQGVRVSAFILASCARTPPPAAWCRRARPAALGCRCTSPHACPAPSAHHLAIGCGCPLWGAPRSRGDGRLSGVLPPPSMQSGKLCVWPASREWYVTRWHGSSVTVPSFKCLPHRHTKNLKAGTGVPGMQRKRLSA